MRPKLFQFTFRFFFFLALVVSEGAWAGLPGPQIPQQLVALAARAKNPAGWSALRRFAKSSHDNENQGMAWFTVGYREYAAGKYAPALEDLGAAAETQFSLSDFATYYEGRSARAAEEPGLGAEALRDFASRYPQSLLHVQALDLLAELLIESNQAAEAAKVLLAEPRLHSSPTLMLRLADAQNQAGNPVDAARAAEAVYYRFPLSSQAGKAQVALREIQRRLGTGYPAPAQAMRSDRARILFRAGRFEAALEDYTRLEQEDPASSLALDWTLARARCLFRLKRYEQVAEIAGVAMTGHPRHDAARLEILVNIRAHQNNEDGMTATLNDLGKGYPASPSYGLALSHAGFYYARRGNWKAAAPYYSLADSGFPSTPAGEEATWKTAWYDYLAGNTGEAARSMAGFILRYPRSIHVPAALYWLGRIAQDQSDSANAGAYFRALLSRYPQQYYAAQALTLAPQRPQGIRAEPALSSSSPGAEAATSPTAASVIRALPSLQGSILAPCTVMPKSGVMQEYRTFVALSLDDLAAEFLRTAIAAKAGNPWAYLALARTDYSKGRTTAALFAARRAVPDYQDFEFDALPREVWEYLYPRSYWSLVRRDARANHLDPYLVMAVIRQESAFDPRALSGAGAVGLMQMLPQTVNSRLRGRRRLVTRRLENPAYNLRLSCHYLRRLLTAFGGNTGEALAAYNAGDVRVREWLDGNNFRSPQEFIETTPFADTRAYVDEILRDAGIYRQLLGGTARFASCDRSSLPPQKLAARRASRRRRRQRH